MIDLDGVVREGAERMMSDGWTVTVRSQWIPDRDAAVYQFTFQQTAVGTAHVNSRQIVKAAAGEQEVVKMAERVVRMAMAEAGVDEVDRLRAWKDEAQQVLDEWDELAHEVIARGDPAQMLGMRKVDIVRMAVGSAP